MASNQSKVSKYKLNMNAKGEWEVLRFGKVDRTFNDWNAYESAMDYIQSSVEDDSWHAKQQEREK